MQSPPQVLIVGAGPVGLTLAIELARHGISFQICDKAPAGCSESRAAALHARTLEHLEPMGLVQEFLEAGRQISALNLYSEKRRLLQLKLEGIDSPYSFVLALSQSRTEELLNQRLESLGMAVQRSAEVVALRERNGSYEAIVCHSGSREEAIRVPYVAACDGAHSFVRKSLGVEFSGGSYHQTFLLGDARIDWELSDRELSVFIEQHGAMVAVPLEEGGLHRFAFAFFDKELYSVPPDEASNPSFEEIQRLASHFAPCPVALSDPKWLSRFHVHHRIVEHCRVGGVFLLGDAAHLHSPLGGQGMNTGMQDAVNLGWKLAFVLKGIGGEMLLESYEAERLPVGRAVVRGTGVATRLLLMRKRAPRALRNWMTAAALGLEPLRSRLLGMLSETEISYAHSPIIGEYSERVRHHMLREPGVGLEAHHAPVFSQGIKPGHRMLDAPLCGAGDGSLFSLLSDPRMHLLVFSGTLPNEETFRLVEQIVTSVAEQFSSLICPHLIVCSNSCPPILEGVQGVMLDPYQEAHDRYGARYACCYLIRPDGYVSFRSQPPRIEALEEHIRGELKLNLEAYVRSR